MLMMLPAKPECQKGSNHIRGISNICNRGNQLLPTWTIPGVRESITRLAMFKCDTESL